MPFPEIARRLGISKQRAEYLCESGLRKLRMRAMTVREYAEQVEFRRDVMEKREGL